MVRREYQTRLETLRTGVIEFGDLVLERLDAALRALKTGDRATAQAVAGGDDDINDRYLEFEGICIDLLALQQPVAADLRLVVASFKIITDLERIGDLAANLAEYALEAERDAFPEIDLEEIGRLARRMVADAMAAYADREDEWACREVAALDDDLDALCAHASKVVVRHLLEYERANVSADDDLDRFMHDVFLLLYTIRDLERIGDHAVNVAARTLYMVESDPGLI